MLNAHYVVFGFGLNGVKICQQSTIHEGIGGRTGSLASMAQMCNQFH